MHGVKGTYALQISTVQEPFRQDDGKQKLLRVFRVQTHYWADVTIGNRQLKLGKLRQEDGRDSQC